MPESSLRNLAKRGLIPGFYSGSKFLVDTKRLAVMLDTGELDGAGRA